MFFVIWNCILGGVWCVVQDVSGSAKVHTLIFLLSEMVMVMMMFRLKMKVTSGSRKSFDVCNL